MIIYILVIILILCGLEWYNRRKASMTLHRFDHDSFIFGLQPYELIYLKSSNISTVIMGTVNELIDNYSIRINKDQTLSSNNPASVQSREHRQVIDLLQDLGKTSYPNFLSQLITKPVFSNTVRSMDALKKYINRSRVFGNLFIFNYIILLSVIMFGLLRIITGILRDKPVVQISFMVIILLFFMIGYLFRLTNLFSSKILPDRYRKVILPQRNTDNNWQWSYFLLGTAVLTTSFAPLTSRSGPASDSPGGDCSTSSFSDSSCGGSSCGGCGGD